MDGEPPQGPFCSAQNRGLFMYTCVVIKITKMMMIRILWIYDDCPEPKNDFQALAGTLHRLTVTKRRAS